LAKQYFQELIQKTKSNSLGEELALSSKQINLTLMSQREVQRKTMERSLERMNQNFFMKAPPQSDNPRGSEAPVFEKTPIDAKVIDTKAADNKAINVAAMSAKAAPAVPDDVLAQMQPVDASDKSIDKLVQKLKDTKQDLQQLQTQLRQMEPEQDNGKVQGQNQPQAIGPVMAKVKAAIAAAANSSPAVTANAATLASVANTTAANTTAAKLTAANMAAANMAAANTATTNAAPSKPSPGTAKSASAFAQAASSASGAVNAVKLPGLGGRDTSSKDQDTKDQAEPQLAATVLGADGKLHQIRHDQNGFQAQLAQQGKAPQPPVTVPDLIQNAKIMVRDGGGDMKVTLHPDGLGQVAMKVSVDHGKVNVQMITESDEAKKLIQRELGDLKSQLALHHLQVNDIKVDTASNLGRQLEQQYHEAQRQATQQAWQQFRQDNQGWKRSFFQAPSARQYRGVESAPRDGSIPATADARARRMANRRLDLVA
jgi:flagellar hook-length control protein FliK